MIIENNNFILEHIASSGQCFRMNRLNDSEFSLIAGSKYLKLRQVDNKRVELSCDTEEYDKFWSEYFDLNYDYEEVVGKLLSGEDEFLRKAADYGYGLRILKQELFEILITFIISQRKSIPAIKRCVEELSVKFGEERKDAFTGSIYYTFPTAEALSKASKETLRETGLGYRDVYVRGTAAAVINGDININSLPNLTFEEAVKELMRLPGVGIKVANCVALYGLHQIDAFPIDVWIERILKDIYDNQFETDRYKGYAGIVQQYMFYYIRSL